jgi:hypothetical protein
MATVGDIFVTFFDRSTRLVALASVAEGLVTILDRAATSGVGWDAAQWHGRIPVGLYGGLLLLGGSLLLLIPFPYFYLPAITGAWIAAITSLVLVFTFVGQALFGEPPGHGPGAGIAYALIAGLLCGIIVVQHRLHARAR